MGSLRRVAISWVDETFFPLYQLLQLGLELVEGDCLSYHYSIYYAIKILGIQIKRLILRQGKYLILKINHSKCKF